MFLYFILPSSLIELVLSWTGEKKSFKTIVSIDYNNEFNKWRTRLMREFYNNMLPKYMTFYTEMPKLTHKIVVLMTQNDLIIKKKQKKCSIMALITT